MPCRALAAGRSYLASATLSVATMRPAARWPRLLQGRLPDDVEIAELEGEAMELLARFGGADAAFLVDACWSGAPAGSVRRLDVNVTPLQQGLFSLSTHGFGLAEAVELARALAQLPPYCVVYAIEGATFETGAPLSPAVAAAVADVAGACKPKLLTKTMLKTGALSKPC